MMIFENYKEFFSFIMNYEGELTIKKSEIYKEGILIGKMQSDE